MLCFKSILSRVNLVKINCVSTCDEMLRLLARCCVSAWHFSDRVRCKRGVRLVGRRYQRSACALLMKIHHFRRIFLSPFDYLAGAAATGCLLYHLHVYIVCAACKIKASSPSLVAVAGWLAGNKQQLFITLQKSNWGLLQGEPRAPTKGHRCLNFHFTSRFNYDPI